MWGKLWGSGIYPGQSVRLYSLNKQEEERERDRDRDKDRQTTQTAELMKQVDQI